jgi:signal transduction histidine kinase/ActR/RegA family two-component response regulator
MVTDGAALLEVVRDAAGAPVDYVFLDVNPAYEGIIGAGREARVGRRMSELYPGDAAALALFAGVITTGQPVTELHTEAVGRHLRVTVVPAGGDRLLMLLSDMTDRKRAQAELQATRDRLITELAGMTRLHGIATRFVREGDLPALLAEAVDAAIAITGADMGTIQLLDEQTGELALAAHRGFNAAFTEHFASVAAARTACRAPLARGERAVIDDVAATCVFVEPADRDATLAAGVRAMQSTPLRSRSGKVVGLLSTHHRDHHRPQDRDLQLLDLLARQCADAIERAGLVEERARLAARAEWDEKLRETEARFRTTVENIPVNLVLYDRHFRILYINPALAAVCAKICNEPVSDFVGRQGEEIWPLAVWTPLHAHTLRAIETGERQTYELAIGPAERPTMVRQWTVVPLAGPDGQVNQILAMSHDITAQRRLVDELREADRRKSEFIALLSHELRNPLAAIRTSLYVLEHGAPGSEAGERARHVIDRQVGHLVRMVDDLLDVTRITRDKVELQRRRLDVNELVRQTVEDNRGHLERGGVRLETKLTGGPVYVHADGARIAQVVTNLLSNAAKFTPEGGTATVTVASDGAAGTAVLSVADTGSGIDPALLPRLFEPFMQADRTLDRTGGGLGLGLALVKGLVELHGGTVVARSAGLGTGAELTVTLPLDAAQAVEVRPQAARAAGTPQRRVLVIEDDPDVAEGLQAALQIDAHQVEVARDGHDGLDKARAFKPDVVLCDIGLPGMDGFAVARAFRADAALRGSFLVALSGYAQAEDLARARAAGFDHHLAKPASLEKIRQVCGASLAAPAVVPVNGRGR